MTELFSFQPSEFMAFKHLTLHLRQALSQIFCKWAITFISQGTQHFIHKILNRV